MRKIVAVVSLVFLAIGVVATSPFVEIEPGESSSQASSQAYFWPVVAEWCLTVPLFLTVYGVIRERFWARFLAFGGALAVILMGTSWLLLAVRGAGVGSEFFLLRWQPAVGWFASIALVLSLSGREMFRRYEGQFPNNRWSGGSMLLVRSTLIVNIATMVWLALLLGDVFWEAQWGAHGSGNVNRTVSLVAGAAAIYAILVVGLFLLARQKTVGLFVVFAACAALIPMMFTHGWRDTGAQLLHESLLILPGVICSWITLIVFSVAAVRFLGRTQ